MRILWINEESSFIGGCESYIFNTVLRLSQKNIFSTLLYDPLKSSDFTFLNCFERAFPLVDLENQLETIPHDVIYIHQVKSLKVLQQLTKAKAPVIRFLHDHELFCLRGSRLSLYSNTACEKKVECCYPLRGTIVRDRSATFGLRWKTLASLQKLQAVNRKFDAVIVASKYMEEQAYDVGFSKKRVHILPLYPYQKSFSYELRDSKHFLFVGQLIRAKGLDILLKAMALLPKEYSLTIAGSGKQEGEYKKLAEKLKLQERVAFLGRLPQDRLLKLYNCCCCLVLPSRWPEPFGLVGLEAMHAGACVIASQVGGISEWLQNGKTGILVPPNDPKLLSEAMLKVGSDSDLGKKLGASGKDYCDAHFSSEKHVHKLLELFSQEIAVKQKSSKLTVVGDEALESRLESLLTDVKKVISENIPVGNYTALLLIGGYGKGEGGVEFREGQEYPHNNMDFLFITTKEAPKDLKSKVDELLKVISEKYQIGFDTSVVSESKLMRSWPLLIWYEMFHGHRLLLGNDSFLQNLGFSDLAALPPSEFSALFINRGSLLIINEVILHSVYPLETMHKKAIIKHLMKAVIGFGDALLYFHGAYHWSYRQRRENMKICAAIDPEIRMLYDEAAAFRFFANYDSYLDCDFSKWNKRVKNICKQAYEHCFYGDLAVKRRSHFSLREIYIAIASTFIPPKAVFGRSFSEKLRFWISSKRKRLARVFPYVAFGLEDVEIRKKLRKFFGIHSAKSLDIEKAYLLHWCTYGDINLPRSLKEWGISLDINEVGPNGYE